MHLSLGNSSLGPYVCAFWLAVFSALLSTRAVRDIAIRRKWAPAPSLSRHLHRTPVPRIGGIAIYVSSWLAALAVLLGTSPKEINANGHSTHELVAIFLPGTVIFVVGLLDDFYDLRAGIKVAVQIFAAVLLYALGLRVTHLDAIFGSGSLSPLLALLLTIAWVLVITNAFNLIDGLDGLAAGSAFFSALIILLLSLLHHGLFVAILVAALAGSLAGFLRYNFNPASIFLGDCGSLYIGFLLSAAALAESDNHHVTAPVAVAVVAFGLPVIDVAIAILRRFLRGRPLFEADAEHIHHRLLKRGLSHRCAVLILYGVSATFGLFSLLLYSSGKLILPVLMVAGVGVFVGLRQLHYQEFVELWQVAQRTMNQRRVIANNLAVRRAAEALDSYRTFNDIGRTIVQCLESIGFDGVAIEFTGMDGVPESALLPFYRSGRNLLQLGAPDLSAFRLEFGLASSAVGNRRSFSVFRTSCNDPLWLDTDVFVSSGFTAALDGALRRAFVGSQFVLDFDKHSDKAKRNGVVPSRIALR